MAVAYLPVIPSGRRGGQRLDINKEHLEYLLGIGFSVSKIAKDGLLGGKIHRNTISSFMSANGMTMPRQRFSAIPDAELNDKVLEIHKRFPKSGSREIKSFLERQEPRIKVQRERVRNALRTVDPLGTADRFRSVLKRRVYKVPTPNYLWHLDTNHKLIMWNFVIHGCVDGYSRLQTHMKVSTDNLAETSLRFFVESMKEFGIPARIRVDGGSEFVHIETFMNSVVGNNTEVRCLRGKSVHNVRIERLWRDTREKVLDKYRYIFMHMEEHNILDINNDVHLFSLHYVYQPRISEDLENWRVSWNHHGLRTEGHQTPLQLWHSGAVINRQTDTTAMNNIFRTTAQNQVAVIDDFLENNNLNEPDIRIQVSCVPQPVTDAKLDNLKNSIIALRPSDNGGIEIYAEVVAFVNRCLSAT